MVVESVAVQMEQLLLLLVWWRRSRLTLMVLLRMAGRGCALLLLNTLSYFTVEHLGRARTQRAARVGLALPGWPIKD